MASKYDPLRDYLLRQRGEIFLSYEEVEEILGGELPDSARRANWWANPQVSNGRAQRNAWGDAGYLATPRQTGVLFRRGVTTHSDIPPQLGGRDGRLNEKSPS